KDCQFLPQTPPFPEVNGFTVETLAESPIETWLFGLPVEHTGCVGVCGFGCGPGPVGCGLAVPPPPPLSGSPVCPVSQPHSSQGSCLSPGPAKCEYVPTWPMTPNM